MDAIIKLRSQRLANYGNGIDGAFLSKVADELESLSAELGRAKADNANLKAALRGRTMYHSDEDVMAELGRVRAEGDELQKENTWLQSAIGDNAAAYQKGREDMRERAVQTIEAFRQGRDLVGDKVYDAVMATLANTVFRLPITGELAAIRSASSQPAEQVCEWGNIGTGSLQYVPGCGERTWCGPIIGKFCPHCGKVIKVAE